MGDDRNNVPVLAGAERAGRRPLMFQYVEQAYRAGDDHNNVPVRCTSRELGGDHTNVPVC